MVLKIRIGIKIGHLIVESKSDESGWNRSNRMKRSNWIENSIFFFWTESYFVLKKKKKFDKTNNLLKKKIVMTKYYIQIIEKNSIR